jgi:hypothetical protein
MVLVIFEKSARLHKKNLEKSGKIWENLEKSEKYAKKIGQNRTK